MSLILSGEDLLKTLEFETNLGYNTCEGHMRSTCRKLKSQCISRVTHDLAKSWSDPEMLKQLEFVCDSSYPSLTLYIRLITHNIVKEILDRKS